ncbi:MAG TPA: hypothetical protein VH678_05055 [Xanthobacteraceae bacterium]
MRRAEHTGRGDDLAEPRSFFVQLHIREKGEGALVFDILVESELRPWQEADRDIGLATFGKAARHRIRL